MNTYEVEEGVRIDLNYDNDFDSVNIYKNQKIFSSSKENNVDNYNLIKGEEYCYRAVGYKEEKKSISNTNCIIIKENHNPLPIANTFSPNGDGLNDEFKPFPRSVKDYNLLIYDMSGVKVFESQDINIGWNGYYDGKITQGSYIYILNFVFDGKDVNQRGKFLLIK
jgi:gliding motility-associated-like protein